MLSCRVEERRKKDMFRRGSTQEEAAVINRAGKRVQRREKNRGLVGSALNREATGF
jgi:hypothetical protein